MMRCLKISNCISLFCAASALLSSELALAQDVGVPQPEVSRSVRRFLETTCFKCHADQEQQGEVRLDQLSPSLGDPAGAQLWQDVLDAINLGEMPPPDEDVNEDELAEAIGELTIDLLKARRLLADTGGEVVVRRLTELEYINSIHAMTGVSVPDELVPDDESGIDFNTLGHYQTFSPAMLEQYEVAARYAVTQMMTPQPQRERKVVRSDDWKAKRKQKERTLAQHIEAHERAKQVPEGTADFKPYGFVNDAKFKDALKLSAPSGFYQPPLRHYLANPNTKTGVVLYQASMGPLTAGISVEADAGAKYIFRARVAAEPGMPEEAKILRLTRVQNRQKTTLGYFHVDGSMEQPEVIETEVHPEAGQVSLQLGFSDLFRIRKSNSREIQQGKTVPGYWVDWIEIEGPIFSTASEERRKEWLGEEPFTDANVSQVFESFARRAFRGTPVDESLIGRLESVYRDERTAGKPQNEALITPLTMILSSPAFLYLGVEKNDDAARLTGPEMATRLSYMFWKEPASPELLAGADKLLTDREYLEQTVDTMIADPRFDRFVREYFGQWLRLRKYDGLIFEKAKVAEFGRARKHFAKEQLYHFVSHIIQEDLSLTNLIDSDFTLLNGTMANLYRDLEVKSLGDDFIRVSLADDDRRRGGLLGMTVIQAMGSTGENTSPVERGAFILRKFLNSPPPPPPPNVPQIAHDDQSLSVREKLAVHKAIPQCVSCHRKMDDMGLAMEQFDVLGIWRQRDHGSPIETAGLMPDGKPFKDFVELKSHLMGYRDDMVESMVEALIAYSLGRESEFSDRDFIDRVAADTKANGYRFRDLLKSFIRHERFTRK